MTNNVKLQLRLPDELHDRLRRSASRHDRSLNGQILTFLRTSVGEDERAAGRAARTEENTASTVPALTTPAVTGGNGVAPIAAPRQRRPRRALAAATA